jgi:hypothetical protein
LDKSADCTIALQYTLQQSNRKELKREQEIGGGKCRALKGTFLIFFGMAVP